MDKLRAESEARLIGKRTLHEEDPKLTIKSGVPDAEREAPGLTTDPAKVGVCAALNLAVFSVPFRLPFSFCK